MCISINTLLKAHHTMKSERPWWVDTWNQTDGRGKTGRQRKQAVDGVVNGGIKQRDGEGR